MKPLCLRRGGFYNYIICKTIFHVFRIYILYTLGNHIYLTSFNVTHVSILSSDKSKQWNTVHLSYTKCFVTVQKKFIQINLNARIRYIVLVPLNSLVPNLCRYESVNYYKLFKPWQSPSQHPDYISNNSWHLYLH